MFHRGGTHSSTASLPGASPQDLHSGNPVPGACPALTWPDRWHLRAVPSAPGPSPVAAFRARQQKVLFRLPAAPSAALNQRHQDSRATRIKVGRAVPRQVTAGCQGPGSHQDLRGDLTAVLLQPDKCETEAKRPPEPPFKRCLDVAELLGQESLF